jgi:uncharacterized protein (DUF1330 family)
MNNDHANAGKLLNQWGMKMTAYVVVHAKIKDPDKLAVYSSAAGETIAAHGGKFVVRAPVLETLIGEGDYNRFVLIEFADAAAARNWYASEAYQALITNRDEAADMFFTLAEAV